jgi:hypothetical protein
VAVHTGLMLEAMEQIYGADALLGEISVVP